MSKKTKLLVVIPTLSAGGAEGFMVNLALSLVNENLAIQFYLTAGVRDSRGDLLLEQLNSAGIKVVGQKKRPSRSFSNIFSLSRLIRVWQPDIVQANLYPAEVITAFAKAFITKKRRPILISRIANTKFPIPPLKFMATWLFRQFDAVLACSPAAKESYVSLIKNNILTDSTLLNRPIEVIRNGCAVNAGGVPGEREKEEFRQKYGIEKNDFVVGHVGRMTLGKGEGPSQLFTSQKAHNIILRAFSEAFIDVSDARLFLLGDGPGRNHLEHLAQKLGISDKVTFLGIQDSPYLLLSISDLFFFPSRYEGLPNALLEAAAFGLPVIASDIPEIREVKLNPNWKLCKVDDVGAFAEALGYARENRDKLKEHAQIMASKYQQEFSMQNCARRYYEFYEGLLASKRIKRERL